MLNNKNNFYKYMGKNNNLIYLGKYVNNKINKYFWENKLYLLELPNHLILIGRIVKLDLVILDI